MSSAGSEATSVVPPSRPLAETIADDPDEFFVGDKRRRRWAWAGCLLVLALCTAVTVALLLMQWMSSGSGTVAR